MKIDSDWDKEQFLTFVLLYAAFADLNIKEEEEDYISNKVGIDEYNDVKKVFMSHTDIERAQMIASYSQDEDFDREYAQMIKNELEDLFLSDGSYTQWEKSIGRALVRLMNL
jgi:hypothetical protein